MFDNDSIVLFVNSWRSDFNQFIISLYDKIRPRPYDSLVYEFFYETLNHSLLDMYLFIRFLKLSDLHSLRDVITTFSEILLCIQVETCFKV